jgi:hypothetical protein
VKLQPLTLRRTIASGATLAVALGVAGGLLAAPANAASGPTCDGTSCTETFDYTGAADTFTVPIGVSAVTVAVSGAAGGAGQYGSPGGGGATVGGVIAVTPDEVLNVLVGQAGTASGGRTFGGGGAAPSVYEASGGGGSFIFDAAGAPLVAAGGGGGGGLFANGGAGAGADTTGGSGAGCCGISSSPPTGGTQTSGGVHGDLDGSDGGDGSGPAANNQPGQGGDGGGTDFDSYYSGAGGGGGYYGGGGASYSQTGAGGSGYADPSLTGVTSNDGANGGNGVVSISWALAPATVALTVDPSTGSTVGDSVTLTATVSGALGTATGTVEFDANGNALDDCSAQPVTGGVATCETTALAVGSDNLQAAYSGDTTYAATTSDSATYPVAYTALGVTTTSLPSGHVGDAYSTDLAADGGLAPYTWTLVNGALPQGLSLSSSGTISGTPTAATSSNSFTVMATDAQGTAFTATAPESIDVSAISTAVSVTAPETVFGQDVEATATVTSDNGNPDGTVQFAVDGTDLGSPVTVADGTAVSPALTDGDGHALAVGSHDVTATFVPSDLTTYAGSTGPTTQVVDQADTTTAVAVHGTTISASVAPVGPGAGDPSGTVTFSVGGNAVGTANVVGGVATLDYTVQHGDTKTVGAVYAGDGSFTGSSDSTARTDPTITATLTSAHATSHGWYRTPVTVSFTCTTNGADLTGPCPGDVQVSANGAGQSVTRTITATDGGVATVAVSGINVDHTAPSVKVTGIKNGATYGGKVPAAKCVAHDSLSGVASCAITRHTTGTRTSYSARAIDKAGNTTTTSGSYHVASIYLKGATYTAGAFTVHSGHQYTLVVTGQAGRPVYYDATVFPHKPSHREVALSAAGHHRWVIVVHITRSMASHHYWNLGVKTGHTMHKVKIRIA